MNTFLMKHDLCLCYFCRCSCDSIMATSQACVPLVTCPEAAPLIGALLQRSMACVRADLSEDFLAALSSAYSRYSKAHDAVCSFVFPSGWFQILRIHVHLFFFIIVLILLYIFIFFSLFFMLILYWSYFLYCLCNCSSFFLLYRCKFPMVELIKV